MKLSVRDWTLALIVSLTLFASAAVADDEVITFSQVEDGSIWARMDGIALYCEFSLGGFIGDPVAAFTSDAVIIDSHILEGECNPPPIRPPPTPFSLTVRIGWLQDGEYSVDWVYLDDVVANSHPLPPQNHYASFTIESRDLVIFKGTFEAP